MQNMIVKYKDPLATSYLIDLFFPENQTNNRYRQIVPTSRIQFNPLKLVYKRYKIHNTLSVKDQHSSWSQVRKIIK